MRASKRSLLTTLAIPAVFVVAGAVVVSNWDDRHALPLAQFPALPQVDEATGINLSGKSGRLSGPAENVDVADTGTVGDERGNADLDALISRTRDVNIAGLSEDLPLEPVVGPNTRTIVEESETAEAPDLPNVAVETEPRQVVVTEDNELPTVAPEEPYTFVLAGEGPQSIVPEGRPDGRIFALPITPVPVATPPESDINQLQEAPENERFAEDPWNVR